MRKIESKHVPFGFLPTFTIEARKVDIKDGDILLMLSDGVFSSNTSIDKQELFAYDEDIPEEYRVEVEHKILHLALSQLAGEVKDFDIYLPYNANLLILDYGESYFEIIKEYILEENLPRIVLVISEHNFKGDFSQLNNILRYLRTYGMKVAINQVGSESHLDYIKMISPNILKVNIEQLSYESWSAQNDLFTSLGTLARKMGANMLFEGIDTVHQLQFIT